MGRLEKVEIVKGQESVVDKVLRSGLVDKHTVAMMERFGMLPEGSTEKVGEVAKDQMGKLAEELAEAVEREHVLRETALDLDRLRWPTTVAVRDSQGVWVEKAIEAVIDRMGRYYFRPGDVDKAWFVPGRLLMREGFDHKEMIVEIQELYSGDQVAAIQVSTVPV